jgi:NitT/TauT family transport system permease protein
MTIARAWSERSSSLRRSALTLIIAAALYDALARSGYFPQALTPTLGAIAQTLFASLADGTMLLHAAATLYRVLIGFGFAVAIGLPLGVLMGRFRPVENFVLPLMSALMPIPSLANTWSGVRAVNPIWLRAASAMGANEHALFWKVIIPGASPFIIAGLRQSFLRAWIAVIGAEMLAGSDWGLGWVIFDAKEFLDADVMLAALIVIGFIGFVTERLGFGSIERATIYRWGMARAARV